jgi:hypothetical protein
MKVQSRKLAQRFEDLIVWQKSHQLGLRVYRATGSFPSEMSPVH